MSSNQKYLFLFLSFLEGGTVMAAELLGAKMLAPYFGTSLPIWAAALALTLGGLMAGYFLGGRLSKRFGKDPTGVMIALLIGGLFLALMPFTSEWIMHVTVDWDLKLGAVTALFVFMVPPLACMGMVSPLIIELLTFHEEDAGNMAGSVYAISTFGGILVTFLTGFWIIPAFGITSPALFFGFLLALIPIFYFLKMKRWLALLIPGAFLILLASASGDEIPPNTLYHEDGILGTVEVRDFEENGKEYRGLFVNNTLQTVQSKEASEKNYWKYPGFIEEFASVMEGANNCLLLGMAGGTLVGSLQELGLHVTALEIDARMKEVAIQYFDLDPETRVIIDDARHFLNITQEKFDLIIFDTFQGESAPEHLLTRESLELVKQKLTPEGYLIINFYGFESGQEGLISHALFQTLENGGWHTKVFATPGVEKRRNLEFICKTSAQSLNTWEEQYLKTFPNRAGDDITLVFQDFNRKEDLLLSDQFPRTLLYNFAAKAWRDLYRQRNYGTN